MTNHVEELCGRPIAGTVVPRDLNDEPITKGETLDCLLLTAALDREHPEQMKQAMEAMAFCAPEIADLCRKNLGELRRLPDLLRENPDLLMDELDLDDRIPEITQAGQVLRTMADMNLNQAGYLNTAADILEHYWSPLEYEE